MGDPAALHAGVLDALQAILSLTTYDGDVPPQPPADPATGKVFPYAVLWSSAGWTPEDARALGGDADGELEWPVQVTVAASEQGQCLVAARLVRAALEGLVPVEGAGRLREEPGAPAVQPDRTVKPIRFYVPLQFRSLNP